MINEDSADYFKLVLPDFNQNDTEFSHAKAIKYTLSSIDMRYDLSI